MNEVTVIPDQAVSAEGKTTSLMIAEVFGKQHKNVINAIRNIDLPSEWDRLNFKPTNYADSAGRNQPMYEITRDGFTMLAMGFTGSEAMKFKMAYIMAFNRMEKQVTTIRPEIPQTLPDALEAYAKTLREKEVLQLQAVADKPKVIFAESVAVSDDAILVRDMARDISAKCGVKIGGNRLYVWLRDRGYCCKHGEDRNRPTQKSIELGILTVKEGSVMQPGKPPRITRTTMVTGKGQIYFINKFGGGE